jgi:hypothetical protein
MKILILGGRGELGSQVAKASRKLGYIVTLGSRNPSSDEIRFDWCNINTFDGVSDFDVIINAAPVLEYDLYFDFIKKLLTQKKVFVETTASSNLVKSILLFQKQYSGPANGLFVHGAGIFPGITNFLFKTAAQPFSEINKVAFNVKYSVFSKAGRDMCQLMAESLTQPSVYYENQQWHTDKPIGPVSIFREKNQAQNTWKGFLADLPDTQYFAAMHPDAGFIGSYFSPMADALFLVLKLFNFAPKNQFFIKLYAKMFYLMRGIIFKNRTSEMVISVVLNDTHISQINIKDAIYGAGAGVAALLPFLDSKTRVLRVDELVEPEVFLRNLQENEPGLFEFLL